jgi:type IV secretory pathway TrbD component
LNWRTFVVRHWKAIVIVLQISLVALSLASVRAHAEPINTPVGP